MFATARKAVVDASQWRKQGGDVDFIDAWQFNDVHEVSDRNFHHGSLKDDQILHWVRDLNWSAPGFVNPVNKKDELGGRLRLIVCERSRYEPLDFPMSREIFEVMEKTFHLHPATLPTFKRHAGAFSRYLTYCKGDRSKLERIQIILKAPQKREIANYGLSLSYNVQSRQTTALLYGAEVLLRPQDAQNRSTRQYHKIYVPHWTVPPFLDFFRDAMHAWGHPLLLPAVLLEHHMDRTRAFVNSKIVHETTEIERELGVTQVGRDVTLNRKLGMSLSDLTGSDMRARAQELTVRINTHSTRVLFTSRSPSWNLQCSEFLLNLLGHVEPHVPDQYEVHQELEALIECNKGFAEVAVHDIASVRERMALQLNVLYNLVAQMDNALNAQLAASAGRDSTSMKILAFISAIFLPGSFVAGVFSMSMFDWQYDGKQENLSGDGGNTVVSKRFWVYWVIAVPLTLITLLGWGVWWRIEIRRFQQKFKAVTGDTRKKAVEQDGRTLDTYKAMMESCPPVFG